MALKGVARQCVDAFDCVRMGTSGELLYKLSDLASEEGLCFIESSNLQGVRNI